MANAFARDIAGEFVQFQRQRQPVVPLSFGGTG